MGTFHNLSATWPCAAPRHPDGQSPSSPDPKQMGYNRYQVKTATVNLAHIDSGKGKEFKNYFFICQGAPACRGAALRPGAGSSGGGGSGAGCSRVPPRVAGSQAGGGRMAFPVPHGRTLAGKGMLSVEDNKGGRGLLLRLQSPPPLQAAALWGLP